MDDLDHTQSTSLISNAGLLIKYLVSALGGYLVGQGFVSQSTVDTVTGMAVTITPILAGMVITQLRIRRLKSIAAELKLRREVESIHKIEPGEGGGANPLP